MKIKAVMLISISILFAANPALAGLTVSGSYFDAEVAPGQHIEHNMNISTDPGDRAIDLQVDVLGFGRNLQGQNVELKPEEDLGPYTARPFLKVSPRNFTLSPGAYQKVLLEGDVPSDVGEGGRFALVYIHSNATGSGNVGVVVAIEVPVRLTIAGTRLDKRGEIASLNLGKPVSRERQNVSLIFKNTGNYNYYATAEAFLKDRNGTVISNASTPATPNSILPATSKQFDLSIAPKLRLPSGSYRIDSMVKLDNGTILASKEIEFSL